MKIRRGRGDYCVGWVDILHVHKGQRKLIIVVGPHHGGRDMKLTACVTTAFGKECECVRAWGEWEW